MLGLLAASLAADSSKRCDVKDHLRSAGGLPDDCTALDFQFEQLTPKEVRATAYALNGGTVSVFVCRGCKLGAYGMEVLEPALLKAPLQFVTIREDELGALGGRTLARVLNETSLPGMDLRAAGLDAEGGVELARALRGNDALEILNLKASGVDTQGAEAIVDALRENRMLQ